MNWIFNRKNGDKPALDAATKKVMKAAVRDGGLFGTGNKIIFDDRHPTPEFDVSSDKHAEDVVLSVHAAGLNPVDYKAPKALLGKGVGLDVCGTILLAGKNVSSDKFKQGDIVFGPANGSLAEYAIAQAQNLTKLPDGWSVEEVAAIPVVYNSGITGLQKAGLVDKYREKPDTPPIDSILVIGASGGAGTAMLHLAKGMGIKRIAAICSAKNGEFCKDNGATEIIPYDESETMETFLKDNASSIDLIYDAASGSGAGEQYSSDEKFLGLLKAKKEEGTQPPSYLVLNGTMQHWMRKAVMGSPTADPRVLLYLADHGTWMLDLALELLKKADKKPVLHKTFDELTADSVNEGYEILKSRRAKGNVVIKVTPPDEAPKP